MQIDVQKQTKLSNGDVISWSIYSFTASSWVEAKGVEVKGDVIQENSS